MKWSIVEVAQKLLSLTAINRKTLVYIGLVLFALHKVQDAFLEELNLFFRECLSQFLPFDGLNLFGILHET